jgi:hypothetical protein
MSSKGEMDRNTDQIELRPVERERLSRLGLPRIFEPSNFHACSLINMIHKYMVC